MSAAAITITAFENGPVDTIGYVIEDHATKEALIIDTPLGAVEAVVEHVQTHTLHVHGIVLTHGHFDHIGDTAVIAERLAVPVFIHSGDADFLRDPMAHFPGLPFHIRGVERFHMMDTHGPRKLGNTPLAVLHTPGHSPGGICIYFQEHDILFSGDTLFAGSIGRSDLPGGDYDILLQSITQTLLSLPDETAVYPGHGPATTIGEERSRNPFIREYLEHF